MTSNLHGRPIAQPRGTKGLGGAGGNGSRGGGGGDGGGQAKSAEQTFEEQQRQCRAATILESNEMLVWAGVDMCESLAQTKLHFERQLFSLPPDDLTKEWPESFTYSSEDEGTLQPGAVFTSEGWYNPKKYSSVAERLKGQEAKEREREEKRVEARKAEARLIGSPGVAMKSSSRMTSEERKRKSPGERVSNKRASGVGVGKRTASVAGAGSGLQ